MAFPDRNYLLNLPSDLLITVSVSLQKRILKGGRNPSIQVKTQRLIPRAQSAPYFGLVAISCRCSKTLFQLQKFVQKPITRKNKKKYGVLTIAR
jgi:hypothetical protein